MITPLYFPYQQRPELARAIDAALAAGKAVLRFYNNGSGKNGGTDEFPVTEADKVSHTIICSHLSDYSLISEEGETQFSGKNTVWVVDPLDGTSDFVSRTGEFTIMIGLVENHVPVMGVIYWPVKNELFVAQHGKGAYVLSTGKWSRLHVSGTSDVSKARLLASRHHLSEQEKKFIVKLGLEFGSRGSSLKAMEIASGKADLYFTSGALKQWDTCASTCILTEAGGKVTDMLGGTLAYNTPDIRHKNGVLMSNGKLHEEIVRRYREFV